MADYNEINAHRRDSRVTFDPVEHKYTVDGIEFTSVTSLVEDCFEKFDADYWARRKTATEQEALQLIRTWEAKGKEARDKGTVLHELIERHFLGEAPDTDSDDGAFEMFLNCPDACRLKPYRSEWRIFMEEHKLAGTLDFLAERPDGGIELWDWKRSAKICDNNGCPVTENNFGKTGLGIMARVPDTAFYHYALQLSFYRYILETKYDVHPVKMCLGVFHPDNKCGYTIEVPYLEEHVKLLLRYGTSC